MWNLEYFAKHMYSTYHSNPDASFSFARTAEEKEKLETMSQEEFAADMMRMVKEAWAEGGESAKKDLFAGSARRTKLSDAEITALANKYNLSGLDQKSYDNFLDDLAEMGAISEHEKGYLGYGGLVAAGYFDGNGNLIANGHSSSLGTHAALWNSKTDLVKWLNEKVKWKAIAPTYDDPAWNASSERAAERENEMFAAVNSIVNRMLQAQGGSGETGIDRSNVVEQIRNPESSFYQEMFTRMKIQLEESEEEKKKQAIIDALDAILQSLSAKKDEYWKKQPDSVSSMAELSKVIDSLDKDDPRKEQLNLLRQQMQNLGIYLDLDVGVKGKDQSSWGTTLTQQLIDEQAKKTEPSIFDII